MKKYTIEFLQSIEGQIMIAKSIQTWGDKDKEKAKQDYIKSLKAKKSIPMNKQKIVEKLKEIKEEIKKLEMKDIGYCHLPECQLQDTNDLPCDCGIKQRNDSYDIIRKEQNQKLDRILEMLKGKIKNYEESIKRKRFTEMPEMWEENEKH